MRVQNEEAMQRMQRPVQAFVFRVYCCLAIVAFLFFFFFSSLGLPELLAWLIFVAGLLPVLFLYVLWEENLPNDAYCLWPKVWYFRGRQIWPRQK